MKNRRKFEPKIFRRDLKGPHAISICFRHKRFLRQCDFVETITAMDHPGMFGAKVEQYLRQRFSQCRVPDADDLTGRAGRIGQWSKEVECRVNPEFATNS